MFMNKTVSAIMLALILTSMLTLAFNVQSAKAASETIIDTHGDSRFAKYPSGPYWWSVADHDTFRTRAYNNNFWYTYCNVPGQVEYFGTLTAWISGEYEVFIWIPNPDAFGTYTPTQRANYQIYHQGGMTERTVDQRLRTGGWYSLGRFTFDTSASIMLNDNTGEPYASTMIAFDAIKFVGAEEINNPPYEPYNPSPYNGESGAPVTADLSWSGGDPDLEDTVTYDVYFGLGSSPPLVSSGQSATTYNLGTLSHSTKYYWEITARDSHGASKPGPIWDFTTEPEPAQPGFIYIRADGSIDPPTAPIQRNGNYYTLTGNITSDADGIAIEKSYVTVDGAGYTLQGSGVGYGIRLDGISHVTIKNTKIRQFSTGIRIYSVYGSNYNSVSDNSITANKGSGVSLFHSSNTTISGNNITANNGTGVRLLVSFNITVSGNNITANNAGGIRLDVSSNITVSGNNIAANNADGINLYGFNNNISGNNIAANNGNGICLFPISSNITVSGNNIANNGNGICLYDSNNMFYHNNFIDNSISHVYIVDSANTWDDGYPSGGNYWSDYTGSDANGDGIGDTPYVIDAHNQDRYPLLNPWAQVAADSFRFPLDGDWAVSRRFGRWYDDFQGYHLGEDVLRDFEAPVYAPADGIVKHNAKRTDYGYVIVIEHELLDGTSVCSVLGHLREAGRVPVGTRVTKGQIVGYLSSVPEENGGIIHLHFGIRTGRYSTEPDRDGQWRYRGYGPADIVDSWYKPSDFINYYNIQKTPALSKEEGLRVTISSDKTFYQLDETINFNVTVTNPTNETGINIIAHNSSLTIEPPAEIELENPQTFHDLGDINPGESKTLSFTAIAKKVGSLLKTWAKAAGEDLQLGLSMAGAGLKKLSISNTIPTEWSFAVITDLHIGYSEDVKGYLEQAVSAINALRTDGAGIAFVLILGDISHTGEINDFYEAQRILNRLNDPNQDGDTTDGVPYIPVIGNHDIKGGGESGFNLVFWGSGNDKNIQLMTRLEGFHRQDQDSLYYQNYNFSYQGLNFLCLDFEPRTWWQHTRTFDDTVGVYPDETRIFLRENLEENLGENFVLASHIPLDSSWLDISGDIEDYSCSVTNFGGHTHKNAESAVYSGYPLREIYKVVETEAVSQIEFPFSPTTGDTLRIVKVKNGEIVDYSKPKNPKTVLEEHRIFWEHIAFLTVEGFGSYLEPNNPAIFTASYPIYHGFETSIQWAFGDGDSDSGVTASHSYLQEGDYNVTLNITRRNLITNETITETIYRKLCVRTKHTISPLPANSYAISLISAVDLTTVPTNMHFPVIFGKNSTEGESPVAIIGLHFENADANIDFSNLVLDTDTATRKAIVFSSSWPAEVDCDKGLFIPSSGTGSVYICLNATSLNDVKLDNADFVVNDGETVNNITVTSTYYEGKEYYLVYGNVTGFGVGEIFHDVAVTNITLSKTIVKQGFSQQDNVTIYDQGTFDENINITIYVNATVIAVFHNVTLSSWDSATLTFTWNTTGFAYGNYTITAAVDAVLGETDVVDNTYNNCWVKVAIPGDTNGDQTVNVLDLILVVGHLGHINGDGHTPYGSDWYKCMNTDLNNDGQHNVLDLILCANHLGESWP